jgi:hypothetical protein
MAADFGMSSRSNLPASACEKTIHQQRRNARETARQVRVPPPAENDRSG